MTDQESSLDMLQQSSYVSPYLSPAIRLIGGFSGCMATLLNGFHLTTDYSCVIDKKCFKDIAEFLKASFRNMGLNSEQSHVEIVRQTSNLEINGE
jgi:hypothetical protein